MDFTKEIILVFLSAFSAVLQVIGVYVLYHTNNLRATQRMILINVGFDHILCLISSIPRNIQGLDEYSWLAYVPAFNYALIMHYLSIDRMLEIYLHLKYPIYMTKKVSHFIIVLLWLISSLLVAVVLLVTYFHPNFEEKLFMFIFAIMIWCALCTAVFVYSYIYRKWTVLRKDAQGTRQCARANTNAFLLPVLVVFTFILFQGSGSVIIIIQNTAELNARTSSLLKYVIFMLFTFGDISDALIYIFLQKDVRKKILLNITRLAVGISRQFKTRSSS